MLRCACVALMPLLFACSETPSGSSSDASTDARLADLDIEADARVDGKGEVDAAPDASAPDVALPDDCTDPSALQTDGSFASVTEAIRQAEQAGGGVVCIPAGDFDWGAVKEFLMTGGVSLIGAGEEHSTIRWDNTENDVLYELRFEGPDAQTLIQQDRDFFLRAPTQADDGLTYAPYPYPHPLTQ